MLQVKRFTFMSGSNKRLAWQKQKRFIPAPNAAGRHRSGRGSARIAWHGTRWWKRWPRLSRKGGNRFSALAASGKVQMLSEVEAAEVPRTPTGIEEFDRVLGGGLVRARWC